MSRYNLEYEANGKKINLKNLTQEQVREFLKTLKREEQSSLNVKTAEEEERE